jgi:hypothetical protein
MEYNNYFKQLMSRSIEEFQTIYNNYKTFYDNFLTISNLKYNSEIIIKYQYKNSLDCDIIIEYCFKEIYITEIFTMTYFNNLHSNIKNLFFIDNEKNKYASIDLLNAICIHKIKFSNYDFKSFKDTFNQESFIETLNYIKDQGNIENLVNDLYNDINNVL